MSPRSSSDVTGPASTTPDEPLRAPAMRKRKRNVLSCLDCRRRKVKCDHGLPACSKCVLRGVASSCTYDSSVGDDYELDRDSSLTHTEDVPVSKAALEPLKSEEPKALITTQPQPAPISAYLEQKDRISHLEDRLQVLEALVARGPSAQSSAPSLSSQSHSEIPRQLEVNFFKGRGFRTQFYGASCPNSLLKSFPEIRAIMKEAHPGSILEQLQSEQKAIEARYKKKNSASLKMPKFNLASMVPERSIVDHFVQLYINTIEQTYRILHQPTFWRDYETFWNSATESKPEFIAILLLILATVRCMSPKEAWSFDLDGSSARTEAIAWIMACDSWLEQQSQKHRTIAIYQVMCLRVLAASANALKIKQAKLFVEALLEYFKAAGMHRDPSLLEGRCSAFEKEMRRRLWATVMELELQGSLDRGTPSSLSSTPSDCKAPLNINDNDLLVEAIQSPISRPSDEYTSSSYLHIASKSIRLRIKLCSLINDPCSNLGFEQVLQYEQQITDELKAIPKWREGDEQGDHNQVSILLDLQLSQYLIMLHTPYARRSFSSKNRYSRMVCFETAKHILDLHSKLTSSGNFTLCLLRGDVLYAALSTCHNAFLCTPNPGNIVFSGILSNFSSTLGIAFKLLEEKFMRQGRGYDRFWWVSAACSIVQMKLEPELAEEIKLQTTERVAELYRKKLAHMKTDPAILQEGDTDPVEHGGDSDGTWISLNYMNTTNGLTDLNEIFDPSDWTLDNLWPLEGVYDPGVLL